VGDEFGQLCTVIVSDDRAHCSPLRLVGHEIEATQGGHRAGSAGDDGDRRAAMSRQGPGPTVDDRVGEVGSSPVDHLLQNLGSARKVPHRIRPGSE
jgi:hypothetical protein